MPKIIDDELKPYWSTTDGEHVRIFHGDVLETLRKMPSQSVHCAVTSPPYWGLRDYGTAEWAGGDPECPHGGRKNQDHKGNIGPKNEQGNAFRNSSRYVEQGEIVRGNVCKCGAKRIDRQLGSEKIPDCLGWARGENCAEKDWGSACHTCRMVLVFRELRRVLRDDGILWVNYGDTYNQNSRGPDSTATEKQKSNRGTQAFMGNRPKGNSGLAPGNLCGVPWKVAFALQADGWVLRSDIIWHKVSAMPESVRNRCSKAHEYVFMFAKKMGYYYDSEAIKDPSNYPDDNRKARQKKEDYIDRAVNDVISTINPNGAKTYPTRNKRSVWSISSQGYEGAHFACVDDQTECLTRSGWKRHNEVKDGDVIASYSMESDSLLWLPSTFHRYPFDAEMVSFDKRDTSQVLTPNHRCLVKSRKGKVKVKQADAISPRDQFLMSAQFDEIPETSIGVDMASLIGWYSAEGTRGYKGRRIQISQSVTANRESVTEIENLLNRMRIRFDKSHYLSSKYDGKERHQVTFTARGSLILDLLKLCPGKEKSLKNVLTRLPKIELEALLTAFAKGDGHTRPEDGRISIIQKDRKKLETLQIIAVKLGYRAHISQRPNDGMCCLYLTKGRWLVACGSCGKWDGIQKVPYKGIVWCPNVDTGLWLARREGKPFITGNTFPTDLIEPMILAGTSEKGCCAKCGSPWKRILETNYIPHGENAKSQRKTNGANNTRENKEVAGAIRPQEMTHGRATREDKTIGWRPSCECHGKIVKRKVKVKGQAVNNAKIQGGIPNGWAVGSGNCNTGKLSHSYLYSTPEMAADKEENRKRAAEIADKEREETIEEYVSDLPLEDHPIVPCTVLDPFLGSGTTCCVAIAHGRRSVGIELSETYIKENAIKRVEGALMDRPQLAALAGRKIEKIKSKGSLLK